MMTDQSGRRSFLKSIAGAGSAHLLFGRPRATQLQPPIRTITGGPHFHWFGYYDKLEFDPTNRFVLSNRVAFEHRTPQADDSIQVGMVDTGDNDRWVELGTSRAWGWQQGCMLQWRPGSASEVVWNDRHGDRHVCRILDVRTRKIRTLPRPIYALSPDGRWAVTADFSRIQRMRPGYGYVGLNDPWSHQQAPEESGIWRMDLDSGNLQLIFSLADAAKIPFQDRQLSDQWHYFNHLLINPTGSRFVLLHRWRENEGTGDQARPVGGFMTRMITAGPDGKNRFVLDPSGHTSHFIWRDEHHICAWTRPADQPAGFYLLRDQTDELHAVGAGVMKENGHNTYVPGTENQWILNDTYPDRQRREQRPYLFHVATGRRVQLGRFHSPVQYRGEWRCDTHPRCSNDGRTVAIDSPHTGAGRQIHLIDISEIV